MAFIETEDRLAARGRLLGNSVTRLNERGSAVLQVILVLGVLVLSIYFISSRLVSQKNVVLQTSSVLRVRFALHSVMDYMYYNIQRRLCLDDALLEAPQCELKLGAKAYSGAVWEGRSLERILLSNVQATFMSEMMCKNHIDMGLESPFKPSASTVTTDAQIAACMNDPQGNLPSNIRRVNVLDIPLKLESITASHPIYPILEPLKLVFREELQARDLVVRVIVKRDDDLNRPPTGSETYFTVKVRMEDESGKVFAVNRIPLELTSYGTMFPRELGSFGLVIPRDLRLDNGPLSAIGGDVGIPAFPKADFTGQGLIFKSPIYVNQHVHLPFVSLNEGGHVSGAAKLYSPVTFADRIVLGNGWVYEGEQLYKPENAGKVNERLWSDNKLFGGFKMGVLVDGYFDKGLLKFGGVFSAAADKSLMEKCINLEKMKTDTSLIITSEFYANRLDPVAFKYMFGLTNGDGFNPQNAALNPVDKGYWKKAKRDNGSSNSGAVLNVTARLGSSKGHDVVATVQLNIQSTLTLEHDPGVDEMGDWMTNLQNELQAANQLPSSTPEEQDTKAQQIKHVQDQIDLLIEARKNPGTVEIKVTPVKSPGPPPVFGTADQAQPHLLGVTINIQNGKNFYDSAGNRPAPRIEFLAYDPLYQKNILVNPNIQNLKMDRFLVFSIDNDGLISGPGNFSAADRQSPTADAPYKLVVPPYDDTDYLALEKQCEDARNSASGQSFGAAAWNIDFSEGVRASWNMAGCATANDPTCTPANVTTDHIIDEYRFTKDNSQAVNQWIPDGNGNYILPKRMPFRARSIVDECTIESGAELVAGFYMCNRLVINKRTIPLTIIGTFIVKELSLGTTADAKQTLQSGITWMSIYHPEAVSLLRKAGILRKTSDPTQPCKDGMDPSNLPIWAVTASKLSQQQDNLTCNVISLRAIAQPFQWTAADPDCGLLPNASNTTCKNHLMNFFVMEHGRGGGP